MDSGFQEDSKIQQIAEAYSLDAVDFAKNAFGIELNWSDESVQHIEAILSRLHSELPQSSPPEEKIFQFAKMLGSYVGEVFRKNHGATWGIVLVGGEKFPGLQTKQSGTQFWPWGRAQKRIKNGPEDNIWHYYRALLRRDGSDATLGNTVAPKKPWWKFGRA